MDRTSLSNINQVIQGEPAKSELIMSDVLGISIDSRTTAKGDLFFAIQGKRLDGHQFVKDAVAQGAQACVVQRGVVAEGTSQSLIYVDDVNQAFHRFASWYRNQHSIPVIGVTGSVGKTTTRTMIHSVLATFLRGIESPANYNNQFGVPLSIAQISSQHEYAVLELGASQAGEIQELARLSQPNIGVITGIGPSHLEHFGSLDQTASAKGELFEQIPDDGLAVLNGDDPYATYLASKSAARTLKVGFGEQNDVQAVSVHQSQDGISFSVDGLDYFLPAFGTHLIYPALFAIAVGRELGLSSQNLVKGISQFKTVSGRCHVEQVGPWTVIDDSYNSNPVSMAAACQVLRDWSGTGKKIIVMGDMLELGPDSKRYHMEVGKLIAASGVDLLFACGKQAGAVVEGALSGTLSHNRVVQAADVEEILCDVHSRLEPGDVVLVKGSRSLRMERLITSLKKQVFMSDSMNVGSGKNKISCV